MRQSFVILAMLGVAAGSNETLAQWETNSHPTDAPKRHIEKIAVGRHVYGVRQGGTMDGANCRSPIGVGMMDGPPIEQTWESNRAVRVENIGETDVITGVGVWGRIWSSAPHSPPPPPGVGFTTPTRTCCDVASSATDSWKVNCVELT